MRSTEPAWTLTDEALALILHAESDIARQVAGLEPSTATFGRGRLTAARGDVQRSRESAVLRLISTIEAYTDAASNHWLLMKGMHLPAKPPLSWPQRIKHFADKHKLDLTNCAGWNAVDAGINLRNCLAHGLGVLTPYLLADPDVAQRMRAIHVDVHGGRMHPRPTTVPLLAGAARNYVVDLESNLIASV